MKMKSKGTYYYIRMRDNDGVLIAHGYTDNPWVLKTFCSSLNKNRIIDNTQISYDEFNGTLGEFSKVVKSKYKLYITGEDIITTFKIEVPWSNTVEVLSTCSIMYEGFPTYAQRKLLWDDRARFIGAITKFKAVIDFLRPNVLSSKDREIVDLLFYVLLPYVTKLSFVDLPEVELERNMRDDVYGLMKGWYIPI